MGISGVASGGCHRTLIIYYYPFLVLLGFLVYASGGCHRTIVVS